MAETTSALEISRLRNAVANEINEHFDRSEQASFEVTEIKKAGDWAFGMALETSIEAGEGGPASYLFLARVVGDRCEVAIQFSFKFREWVNQAPPELLPEDARRIYGADVPEADGTAQLSLPWLTTDTYRLTNGPHANNSGGPWSSLDFASYTPGMSVPVRASRDGIAYKTLSCEVVVDHQDQWQTGYYHLTNITVSSGGTSVSRGAILGYTSCALCSTGATCEGFHVHWSLRRGGVHQSLDGICLGGWVIHAGASQGAGYLSKDSTTVYPGSTGYVYNDGAVGCASIQGTTTIQVNDSNGVSVQYCPLEIDGQSVGKTDQSGRLVLQSLLCGSHRVRAVLGYLFHDRFVNFVCQNSNTATNGETSAASTLSNTAQIDLESTASCSSLSPANGLAIGDVVEVFGTGNGLRARYPNPCSDSYAVMPDNSVGTIVGTWQCCNGYVRWKIRYNDLVGIDVWSAEGEPSTGQKFLRKTGGGGTVVLEYVSNVVHDGSGGGVGNNDGQVNPGEEIDLDVILHNRGTATATNVSATISTSSNYINITDNDVSLADVPAGGTQTGSDFDFTVSPSVPVGHVINFTLQMSSDQGTATQNFSLTVGSGGTAVLALSTNSLNIGSVQGGGNILVKNNGAGILSWSASSPASWITVLTPSGTIMSQGGEQGLSFSVSENPSTSSRIGTIIVSASGAAGSPQTLTINQAGSGSLPVATLLSPASGTTVIFPETFSWSLNDSSNVRVYFATSTSPNIIADSLDVFSGSGSLTITADRWSKAVEYLGAVTTYYWTVGDADEQKGIYAAWRPFTIPLTALGNVSTRLSVGTGDNVLIGGFIITGTQPKRVIIRGIGPSLTVAGKLANPTLQLYQGNVLLESNDDWQQSPNKQAIIDSKVAPANGLEAAIVATLPANKSSYTAILRGTNGGTGIGVVEAYDLDPSSDSRLADISTRGFVGTGDNVMIGGTIITGGPSVNVLLRAIGPSLTNVPNALQDPTLELHDVNGALIASNDDWRSDQEADITATTIPPTDDYESAILRTLSPGQYTAIVRGFDSSTGVAVVEAYQLQ